MGWPAFEDTQRIFVIKQGELSGAVNFSAPNGRLAEERYRGRVNDDGTVSITGTGVAGRGGRQYPISHSGEIRDGRLKAQGRHADRACMLDYQRIH